MKFTVIIPSRYASTRLPAKALADIGGKPLIAHVVDRANESNASRVIVATDDQRIADALSTSKCEVCLTREDHISGSDRLAEVVNKLAIDDDEIIVNVQGDEPAIPARLIIEVAASLAQAPQAVMSTAAHKIKSVADFNNPNVVKVVFDQSGRALYFSRSPIPYSKVAREIGADAWHHIGIYAYRAGFLKRYHALAASKLEIAESLEQLRVMDNGESIMVHCIDYHAGVGVDTAEDLVVARELLAHWSNNVERRKD
jgi:3-deoxy-manno-octulosonate cytidylyltransferase (CMP-KDO synthetase)